MRAQQAASDMPSLASALEYLASTDHEIIKAIEKRLIIDGALDADLVALRDHARRTVKKFKQSKN